MKHNFGGHPRIFQRVMMRKGNAKAFGYVLETPSTRSVFIWPGSTDDFGAIEPRDLKLFKLVSLHGTFKSYAVECCMTDQH